MLVLFVIVLSDYTVAVLWGEMPFEISLYFAFESYQYFMYIRFFILGCMVEKCQLNQIYFCIVIFILIPDLHTCWFHKTIKKDSDILYNNGLGQK